jgi:hypothetical protein
MTSTADALKTFNDWADFWRYNIGVNLIPANTKQKETYESWKEWQDKPIPEELHDEWKKSGAFDRGMAVILGKTWHNSEIGKSGLYLIGIDLDNRKAIEEVAYKGLTELAKDVIVEQHNDDLTKAHILLYSHKPFPKKSSDNNGHLNPKLAADEIPAIEVKGLGSHGILFVTPSIHKNGQPYQIIGTLEPIIVDDFVAHINNICKKYSIPYLDGNSGIDDENNSKNNSRIPIEDLFKSEFKVYEGHNRHEALMRATESLIVRNSSILSIEEIKSLARQWNNQHCAPPLDDKNFEKQWRSAINFVTKKGSINERDRNGGREEDDDNELSGVEAKIVEKLSLHIHSIVSSNPLVIYVAHRSKRKIIKAVVKPITDSTGQLKIMKHILQWKQQLIFAIPIWVVINNNPLTDNRSYTITFESKKSKKPFTIGPATIAEIIEVLDKKGKVLKKPEAIDALTAIVEKYDESELADVNDGITEPGYYWINNQITGYSINQNLNFDPRNNQDDWKAVLECIDALQGLQKRSKKKVAFPTVLKWGILAPFSFITKTQTAGVEDWLPWLYLYDSTDTGKTTLIINAVLTVWARYDKQQYEIHFRGPGSIDTPSKLGITLSQTTYPILVDEVGGLLNDDSRRDNILLDMIKYSVQGKYARSRFHENILALSPFAFTSNDPPPQDPAYRRRFVAIQFYENEKWTETEKEEFKRWIDEQGIRDKLKPLGDFVARYIIEHPEILKYSSYSWYDHATIILKEFYKSVDKEPPAWIDLIAEQTIVKEVSEERQFELRGFLQQQISEAYRRDIYANPDPNTMIEDSYGRPIRSMTPVSFSQKIDYCLNNKSIPFLHLCKKNFGQEIEVAITSNIRSELKKYDKSASSIMTMNSLASKIPGFEYDLRSVGGHRIRAICGPKKKFLEFLNYEVERTE